MENATASTSQPPIWQTCQHCPNSFFNTATDFERHIQEKHSFTEGSIVLCQYGLNGVCASLQFGDLTLAGFKYHVRKHHLRPTSPNDHWTFYSSSQNLPAVLNDPNKGKQSTFFTKTWGDGFIEKVDIHPSPYLPEITLSHFESYCKKIIKRFRKHCRLKETSETKNESQPSDEENIEVPQIFFQQSLELTNPEVFKQVFPNLSDTEDLPAAIRSLQETLSSYLDVIEIKISKQVAEKSDAFFHAMLSHDTVMEQMASALKLVQKTRNEMKTAKTCMTENSLKLISVTRTRNNLTNLYEYLKLISTVQQTQPMIQLLLSTSDYVAALDLISSTQKVLSTRLTGIHAFRHLSPQLTEMQRLISKMLNSEFQKFIVTDLNRPPTDTTEILEKDKLMSVISGILRLKEFEFIDTFKSESMTTIQATIKQQVIEIVSERDVNTEVVLRGSIADNTSLLTTEGITFLKRAGPILLTILKRIAVISEIIIEINKIDDGASQGDESMTKDEIRKLNDKIKKNLSFLADYCNERCSSLIVNKMEKDHLVTGLSQLSELSEIVDHFSKESETITGYCSNTLRLSLKSFAMTYMQNLHSERKGQLTSSLNTEKWKACDVPWNFQNVIDDIAKSYTIPDKIVYVESDRSNLRNLIINNEPYAVTGTVIVLLKIILEYCVTTKQSPVITQYTVHCLLELLKYFNSRCCQLVLGAGALQSAGLKTITTSNLALVSRSLQVVLWILPIVKSHLQSIQNGLVSLNGFETLESEILSHKQEIENKIYIIVSNLLSSQLSGWEARPPVPSQTFRNISKHLVKLHEALSNIFPINQIRQIYRRVHDNFKDKLREQLIKMNIVANGGPQHGVVTSELTFYLQTLKTLQITNDNEVEDNILYEVWVS